MKIMRFISIFFSFLGSQNDYLYPVKNISDDCYYPFKKPHIWKTRFGFKTSWNLAKIIA